MINFNWQSAIITFCAWAFVQALPQGAAQASDLNSRLQLPPHQVLEIRADASAKEIRAAWLKKVKMHHPDFFTLASPAIRKAQDEKLKEINLAYEEMNRLKPSPPQTTNEQKIEKMAYELSQFLFQSISESKESEISRIIEQARQALEKSLLSLAAKLPPERRLELIEATFKNVLENLKWNEYLSSSGVVQQLNLFQQEAGYRALLDTIAGLESYFRDFHSRMKELAVNEIVERLNDQSPLARAYFDEQRELFREILRSEQSSCRRIFKDNAFGHFLRATP